MSSPSPPSGRSWLTARWVAAVLLLVHFALAVGGATRESLTYDEPDTLIGGYTIWARGDYRLFPDGGRLPQLWATLPLLAMDLHYAPAGPAWQASSAHPVVHEFLWGAGNDAHAITLAARAMIALVGVALGACVWWIARRAFGPYGGLLSLTLYAFSPTLLAHGRLLTSDVAGALFLLLASVGWWAVLQRLSVRTVVLSTLATAGMALAKQSVPLLLPIALLLVAARLIVARPLPCGGGEIRGRGRQLAAFAGVALLQLAVTVLVIWAVHAFRFSAFAGEAAGAHLFWPWDFLTDNGWMGAVIDWIRTHRLLPEAYVYGQAVTLKHAAVRFAFLNGDYSDTGWWWFFPYAFGVKTPLGTLLLAGLGFAALRRAALWRLLPLLVLFSVYWLVALATNLNIGHRHLLPTYAPLFVIAGAAVLPAQRSRALRWVVVLAALSTVVEGVRVFPHHLAYFNPLGGGPRHGYRHLVDSSCDWGQDLPALRDWIDARRSAGDARPVWLSYFGSYDPRHEVPAVRSLDVQWLGGQAPEWLAAGHYAISATNLQAVYGPWRGRWSVRHEQAWQQVRGLVARHRQSEATATWQAIAAEVGEARAFEALQNWRGLRALRLCAYLRAREPDARAGWSILIFTLSADDLRRALDEPLPLGS